MCSPNVSGNARPAELAVRLAVVTSHPIQYQAPLWRWLAAEDKVDLTVFFLGSHGISGTVDPGFDQIVDWDIDLLSGYRHIFLPEFRKARPGSFLAGSHPGIALALRRSRFDAVVLCGYSNVGYLLAAASTAARRVPLYLRGDTVSDGDRTRPSRPLSGLITRGLARLLAGGFTIGASSERWYLERGLTLDQLTRVAYGVDNFRFKRPANSAIATFRTNRLGAHPDDALILWCGKLVEGKDPFHSVALLRELRRQGRCVRGVFAGAGPLDAELRDQVGANDIILGFVNQSEMPLLYSSCDVTVVPSVSETWGLVVNESLAAGTPVVSSPAVPAAMEMAEHDSRVVRIADRALIGVWATAVEEFLDRDRDKLAIACRAAAATADVQNSAHAIASRIVADLARRRS